MSFAVAADSYDRFMGRYSVPLAPQLADLAGIEPGQRVIDVGCGPGALTTELVRRLGPDSVAAVDPSEPFVAAAKERHPGVDVRLATAEQLPFADGEFDAALAQLVVHFMSDPVAGLREMAPRHPREDGVVAACVWDHAGGQGPLSLFWEAAREARPRRRGRVGARRRARGPPHRAVRGGRAARRRGDALSVDVEHPSFEEWWEPFTLGVGPAGAHVASLDAGRQARSGNAVASSCPKRRSSSPLKHGRHGLAPLGRRFAFSPLTGREWLHGAWPSDTLPPMRRP